MLSPKELMQVTVTSDNGQYLLQYHQYVDDYGWYVVECGSRTMHYRSERDAKSEMVLIAIVDQYTLS